MSAFDDLGGKPEAYAEILARSLVAAPKVALTEQELAEREAEARERMRLHDEYFERDYIQGTEAMLISRALAKQLGVFVNEPMNQEDIQE